MMRVKWKSVFLVACLLVGGAGRLEGRSTEEISWSEVPESLEENGNWKFTVEKNQFMKDGKPFRILAGSIHYFRIVREYWEDRLDRMKALGLNAITVYVAWNWHEWTRGNFDFESEDRDLRAFLLAAHKRGLYVILRPGPYICAEWDFGGIPAWTLENGTFPLRTLSQPYLSYADAYLSRVFAQVKDLMYVYSGGPILMVQVENEYGSFGNTGENPDDRAYIEHLIKKTRESLGSSVMLFTTDSNSVASKGSLHGSEVLTLFDGCFDPSKEAVFQKTFNPTDKSPYFCTETYSGWLTHWGERHAFTSSKDFVNLLQNIMAVNNGTGSINIYMAHGGTNFGFMSGANVPGYIADITSYDYNAPIGEAGDANFGSDKANKFTLIRDLLAKVRKADGDNEPIPSLPPVPARKSFGKIEMNEYAPLLEQANLDAVTTRKVTNLCVPVPAETFQCFAGFVLYEAVMLNPPHSGEKLNLGTFHDRAQVWIDGKYLGARLRTENSTLVIPVGDSFSSHPKLQILVEHMGRINFDPQGMRDTRVGLLEGVPTLQGVRVEVQSGWSARCLSFDSSSMLDNLQWQKREMADKIFPAFYRGRFSNSNQEDTFINVKRYGNWGKGVAWVNQFNIGRYWDNLPQRTLFVPGPKTLKGTNEVVLLELDRPSQGVLSQDEHDIEFKS